MKAMNELQKMLEGSLLMKMYEHIRPRLAMAELFPYSSSDSGQAVSAKQVIFQINDRVLYTRSMCTVSSFSRRHFLSPHSRAFCWELPFLELALHQPWAEMISDNKFL
jgi:hypothetical protein